MDKGHEIHIVTSRPKKWSQKWKVRGNPYTLWDNDDLYEVADRLGIVRENIHLLIILRNINSSIKIKILFSI